MAKYQKLEGCQTLTPQEDDYDYVSDEKSNSINNENTDSNISTVNNSIINMVKLPPKIVDHLDDQSWDVPLWVNQSSCEEHDNDDVKTGFVNENTLPGTEPESNTCHLSRVFGPIHNSKTSHEAKFKILAAISLCCIFMVIEFLGGYAAGSLAIMTDAAHLASDCVSFVIGLVAIWVSDRPPDKRLSFGYKRFEVLGALISILGIWLLTTLLVVMAIQRIFLNDYDLNIDVMMSISGIGIAINIIMIFVLHGSWAISGTGHGNHNGHGHNHSCNHGYSQYENFQSEDYTLANTGSESLLMTSATEEPDILNIHQTAYRSNNVVGTSCTPTNQHCSHGEQNLNLRAAMIHVIGDLVQSIGVFLAAILIKIFPSAKFLDPLCTLLFSVIVIMTTLQLFRESMIILLDAVPSNINLHSLEGDLNRLKGVRSVHHVNIWQYASNHIVFTGHIVTEPQSDDAEIMQAATRLVHGYPYNVKHATIQIEQASRYNLII